MQRFYLLLCLTLWSTTLAFGQLENGVRVNEYLGDDLGQKRNPKMATNDDGALCVIWEDSRNGYWHLYVQLIGANRQPVGGNINLTPNSQVQDEEFDVTANAAGEFIIAWGDGPRFRSVIKYTILAPDGSVVLPTATLQTPQDNNRANFPALAALSDGDFLLAYVPYDLGQPVNGNLQKIGATGGEIGPPVVLDTLDSRDDIFNFSIAVAPNGNSLVAYQRELGFRTADIGIAVLDADLNVLRRDTAANVVLGEAEAPSAIALNDGDFALFWLDFRELTLGEVYVREISNSGNLLRTPRNLGTSQGGTRARYPRVARLGSGFVVSTLNRLDGYQVVNANYSLGASTVVGGTRPFPVVVNGEVVTVYLTDLFRGFSSSQTLQVNLNYGGGGSQRFLNDDTFSAAEEVRASAFRDDGSGIVLWIGSDNEDRVVYGREIGDGGDLVGEAFVIFRGLSAGHKIALAPNGRWALYFQEIRDFRTYPMVQIYDEDNQLLRDYELGDFGGTANLPQRRGVEYNAAKNEYFYWEGTSSDGRTFAVRPLNLDGNFLSPLRDVFDDGTGFTFLVHQRPDGDFVITYQQFEGAFDYNLRAAILDSELRVVEDPFNVNETPGTAESGEEYGMVSGGGDTTWIFYELEANDVGPEMLRNPYAYRALSPENTLTTEHYVAKEGNFINLQYDRENLQYWENVSGDQYLVDIDLDSFTVDHRLLIPKVDLRQDFRFELNAAGLSILFRDFREPGRGLDIYHYLSPDADEDGFFDIEDCDDDLPSVYPGAPEIADNGIDENCDGQDSTSTTSTVIARLSRQVKLFPNPANDVLSVRVLGGFPYRLRLMDGRGVVLHDVRNAKQVGVGDLPTGAYWMEVLRLDKAERSTFPVIIRR